ncbi:HNH endonuclease [Peribacillus loiseleuriae]|uniref:HNH endonuclease n=1 Tax=Peribacillus loiseleuriae TaxID=1679170 RepID=UPI0038155893
MYRDHGLCQHCLKDKRLIYADMVDHIIPIKIAWHLRVFLKNLQCLCNGCHAIKTAEDKRKYGDRV